MPTQHTSIARLVASPHLGAGIVEGFYRRFSPESALLVCVTDRDAAATFVSISTVAEKLAATIRDIASLIGPDEAQTRAFRLELQHEEPGIAFSDDVVRAVGVDVHGVLRIPVYIARRSGSLSQWVRVRPLRFGPQGIIAGDVAPTLPFGGSSSLGISVETGSPTIVAKARLSGEFEMHQLQQIANALGGENAGFAEVAATPVVGRSNSLLVELGDWKRTPLHRVFAVIEIEARRFGGTLGAGALLSHAPLSVFTDTLAMHMGLPIEQRQIIETHLSSAAATS